MLRGDVRLAMAQAAIWVGALVTWWLLLGRVGATRAPRGAGRCPAWVLAASGPCRVLWAAAGVSGLRVQESRGALLRAAWPDGVGVPRSGAAPQCAGRTSVPARFDRMLPAMPLEPSDREAKASPSLATLNEIPPGRYRVEAAGLGEGAELRVTAGSRSPLAAVSLACRETDGVEAARVEFDVPVPLSGVDFDVTPRLPSSALQVVALSLRSSLAASGERARQAARFGPVSAFVLSDRTYVEPGGLWLRPGGSSMVLQAETAVPTIRVFVRNPPIANRIDVATAQWRTSIDLAPGAETILEIPLPQDNERYTWSSPWRTAFVRWTSIARAPTPGGSARGSRSSSRGEACLAPTSFTAP